MPYGIVAYFDDDSERAINELGKLATGNGEYVRHPAKVRPHLTLGVWDEAEADTLKRHTRQLASRHGQFTLRFELVGSFPGKSNNIVLVPVVTSPLLAMHRAVYEAIGRDNSNEWTHYLPGRWVPHCTIALNLPPGRVQDALGEVLPRFRSLEARAVELTAAKFYPVEIIDSHSLGPGE